MHNSAGPTSPLSRHVAIWSIIGGVAAVASVVIALLQQPSPSDDSDASSSSATTTTTTTSDGPTTTTLTTDPTTTTTSTTTSDSAAPEPPQPGPSPDILIGHWYGRGYPYGPSANDLPLGITFHLNGRYEMDKDYNPSSGTYEVSGSVIQFLPSSGEGYAVSWKITEFAGQPLLILDPQGANYRLQRS